MTRKRHEFRVVHPSEQRLLLRALNGDLDGETPEETAVITAWVLRLEALLSDRRRVRRSPGEQAQRKTQRSLFARRAR